MKKPRIGYLVTPIIFGGSEKVSLNFLKNADRTKFELYPIVIIRPWEEITFFERELSKLNFKCHRIPVSSNASFDLFRYIRSYRGIQSILKSQSIELLHTHGYLADILGLLAARSLGIPTVSTCHGFVFRNIKLRLYFKLDLWLLKYFSGIIAVSGSIENHLRANGVKSSIIEVIPNAVDMYACDRVDWPNRDLLGNIFNHGKEDLILGYIGRVSQEKGVDYLIEAVAHLKSKCVSAKLLIIGEGPDSDRLQLIVKRRKIENDVRFLGFRNDILPFLKTMDIFVLPSLTEGTPLALLEALSARVPVVATRVGGVPDIIDDGKTGILVSPCNYIELAEAIIKLKTDCALKNSIIDNAAELIKTQYSMTAWITKTQNIYNKILKIG